MSELTGQALAEELESLTGELGYTLAEAAERVGISVISARQILRPSGDRDAWARSRAGRTDQAGARLLTVDQISALIKRVEGVEVKPATLTFYASQSRRRAAAGTLTEHDMPIPDPDDALVVERTGKGKGPRTIVKPRWREAVIREWRLAGRRPLPSRPRSPEGQWLAEAG